MLKSLPISVIVPALLLTVIGVLFIYSATTDFEMVAEGIETAGGQAKRQIVLATLGVFMFLVITLTPHRWLSRYWLFAVIVGVAMLFGVIIFGRTVNGAKSWIFLGPFGIQPSELCKPLLVVALAGYLRYHKSINSFRTFAMCLLITGAFFVPVLLQPDFGTAMVFVPVVAAMVWCAGGNPLYLGGVGASGFLALPAAYLGGILKPHQIKRIDVYLSGLSGEVADKSGDGYQIMQSMTAIGSGGTMGKGFGTGTQSQLAFLPERHNDFIFAVIAEETGFVGVCIVLMLLFFLLIRILSVARTTREPFARLVVVGIAALLFGQAIINIGMVSGALPVTGITLPFVSYGGSSILAVWMSLGLVANIAVQQPRVMGRATF